MKKLFTLWIVLLLAVLTVTACKKEKKQAAVSPPKGAPQAATQPAKGAATAAQPARPGQPTGAAEAKKEGETKTTTPEYSFNPIREDGKQKRNPFLPISIPVNPTRTYEISQLGVNGVILHGVKTASVMTPNCQSTFVKIGDLIGVHDGRVVDITLAGVLVRESFVDVQGRIQEYERLISNQPYKCQ
jgi:Tfp pilus assembly protein PilP